MNILDAVPNVRLVDQRLPPRSRVGVAADDDVAVGHPGQVPGPPAYGAPRCCTRASRTARDGFGVEPGEGHVNRGARASAGCTRFAVVRHAVHRSSALSDVPPVWIPSVI